MIYIVQAFCWRLALFIFGRVVPRPYDIVLCVFGGRKALRPYLGFFEA